MHAARVARRLGAEESIIIYRRSLEQMPAHAEERESAEREGVTMNWLRTISSVDSDDLTVEIMELDEAGKAKGTGRFEKLEADTVILALGQETDSNFLRRIPGMHFDHDVLKVDPRTLMTDVAGIFAGGDRVPPGRRGAGRRYRGPPAGRGGAGWRAGGRSRPAPGGRCARAGIRGPGPFRLPRAPVVQSGPAPVPPPPLLAGRCGPPPS